MNSPYLRLLARRALAAFLFLSVQVLAVAAASSATFTWSGAAADSNWSTAANWAGLPPTSARDTIIVFSGDYSSTTRLSHQDGASAFQLNRLELLRVAGADAGVVTLSGNGLEFVANGTTQPTISSNRLREMTISSAIHIPVDTTLTVQYHSHFMTLSGPITGQGALVLQGGGSGGSYTLSNSGNTFSGGLTILASPTDNWRRVQVDASGAMGTGLVSLSGGSLHETTSVGGLFFRNTTTHSNPIVLLQNSPISAGAPDAALGSVNVTLQGAVNLDAHTLHLRGGGTGTISGAVSGTGGVTKRDAGAWTLSGSNTYTGPTTIAGGVLSVNTLANGGVASSIGQSTNAASNLAFTGGTLRYTGGTATTDRRFTIATSATATFNIAEAGTTLTFNNVSGSSFGTGCVIVKDGPGTLAIARIDGGSGYIGEVGAFVINEGRLGTPAGGQINAGRLADSGAAITMGDGTELSLGTALSSLTVGGNQVVRYVGTTSTAVLSSHISVATPNIVFSGPDDTGGAGVFNTKTFDINDGAADIDLHLSAHIYTWGGVSGAIPVSNLVKTGAGTLKLSGGDSRYRGETVVRDGRIVVGANAASGANGALGYATSAIRMGDAETPTGASLALVTDGPFTMGRNIDVHNFGAGTTLGGISNHTSTFAGTVALNKDVFLTSAATGANATVFSGNITGTGGIVKTGLGTVTLSGEKAYSGSTLVNTGTLALSHAASSNNIAGSPLVRVAAGATLDVAGLAGATFQVAGGQTLGGDGTIAGAATILENAVLAPGMSLGELTFTGRLALEDGAVWDWEFLGREPGEYDRVIGPELLLPTSGTVALNITGLDGYTISAGDSFTLFDGDVYLGSELALPGTDLTSLFHITDTIGWWGAWQVTAGSLTLTAVPEPGSCLLLLSLLASGLLARRRR